MGWAGVRLLLGLRSLLVWGVRLVGVGVETLGGVAVMGFGGVRQ